LLPLAWLWSKQSPYWIFVVRLIMVMSISTLITAYYPIVHRWQWVACKFIH
jgi:ABC-type multidrug transport system fused ATPase/permease subunit